jgi:hypothetical protein
MGYLPKPEGELFVSRRGTLRLNQFQWHRTFSHILAFARVRIELLLKIRLRFLNSRKGAHCSFELLPARFADRDARYLPQVLDDSKSTFNHERVSVRCSTATAALSTLLMLTKHLG